MTSATRWNGIKMRLVEQVVASGRGSHHRPSSAAGPSSFIRQHSITVCRRYSAWCGRQHSVIASFHRVKELRPMVVVAIFIIFGDSLMSFGVNGLPSPRNSGNGLYKAGASPCCMGGSCLFFFIEELRDLLRCVHLKWRLQL